MNQNFQQHQTRHRDTLIIVISIGLSLILLGTIYITTPSLSYSLQTFLDPNSWTISNIPNTNVFIPLPATPSTYLAVYLAALEFCLVWGLFQIFVLFFRFIIRSKPYRMGRTISRVVFWLGTSYLIYTYLNSTTTIVTWSVFWTALIILIGITFIIRAVVLFGYEILYKK